jgi:hypothetical protein
VQDAERLQRVANEADTQVATVNSGVLASAYCRSLTYWLSVPLEQFRLDDFKLAVSAAGVEPSGAICSPRDKSSGYHLHVSWHKREEEFSIRVEFLGEAREPDPKEREPLAENFFEWLDQFFLSKEPLTVHAHAEFRFPFSVRRATFMLLPLKTRLGPKDADVEIDGLSFSISPALEGIERMWITQQTDELWVYIIGERPITLRTFDVAAEIKVLSKTVDILSKEEAKQ